MIAAEGWVVQMKYTPHRMNILRIATQTLNVFCEMYASIGTIYTHTISL